MPSNRLSEASDIAARLDRLPVTPLHAASIILCALGLLFDIAEAVLSNALSAVFSAPPHQVTSHQLSLLLGSVFAGGAIGAPLLGFMADRHGRRAALATSLIVLSAASLMAAASPDVGWLTAFRVLSGLALGAYPPLMVAYLSDVLPPARRGMLILISGAIGSLGAPAVIFLIRALTPLQPFGLEGWRWVLILGSMGSAAVGVLFCRLPESPRWLVAAGRQAAAETVCRRFEGSAAAERGTPRSTVPRPRSCDSACEDDAPVMVGAPGSAGRTLVEAQPARQGVWSAMSERRYRAHFMLLCALNFLSPWATIGFPLLSGAVLVEKGFRVADSLLYVGVAMFGPAAGALVGAFAIDRVERRTALVLCGGAMALIGLAFAASLDPVLLMATGLVFSLIATIYIAALSIYAAELFPTGLRAAASSGAWAVNRIVSALVPLALLPLLKGSGAVAMFAVIAAALAGGIALVLTLGPRGLAGKPVE